MGKQTIEFEQAPYLIEAASVVGTKEGDGPLKDGFDTIFSDDKCGQESWEEAESALQKVAVQKLLGKAKISEQKIGRMFTGDLLDQTMASAFGAGETRIPMYGLYGACSTAGEALGLASIFVAMGIDAHTMAVASSHFASAEKQFRFPLEYAGQRPPSASWTVTGAGAFLVGNTPSSVKITAVTTGKIVDYGVKDALNMGGAMAPAACDTILCNLTDLSRKPKDYDVIATGDLGSIGSIALCDLLKRQGYDISAVHEDCGMLIYDRDRQDVHAGGSGCGCSAVTLAAHYLKKLRSGQIRRMLFVPTGAMLSPTSSNEGKTIPSIAHAVVLEHCED